jgi:hypothetical protein
MFLLRLDGDWGRSSWPTDARTTRHVLALTGSLPGECLKVSRWILMRPIRPAGVLLSRSVRALFQQIQFICDLHAQVPSGV